MPRYRYLGILFFALVNLEGCAGYFADYTPTRVPAGLKPKAPDAVEVYMFGELPKCSFAAVGLYRGKRSWWGLGEGMSGSVEAMKNDAAAHGFDGLVDVKCADPGTVGAPEFLCAAKAYVCQQ